MTTDGLMTIAVTLAVLGSAVFSYSADSGPPLPEKREGAFVVRDFKFRSGETIPELHLGYTTLGTARRDSSGGVTNAVLLLHGTTGTGASWLQPSLADTLFRAGQPLDAGKYFIILPDSIGLGRSSKPSDGLKASFPHYGYHDMVEAQHRLVTEGLGITRLRLVLGTSMGGMHTWLWAIKYSSMMDGAVALTSQPAAITGRNLLWRRIITEAIRNDPDWKGGNYTVNPTRFAYTYPLFSIMVDSANHLQEIGPTREKALEYYNRLVENAKRLDANDYLYRFEASADYDPWPDLPKITVKLLAINFVGDVINPEELGIVEKAMSLFNTGRSVLITPEKGKSLGSPGPVSGRPLGATTSPNFSRNYPERCAARQCFQWQALINLQLPAMAYIIRHDRDRRLLTLKAEGRSFGPRQRFARPPAGAAASSTSGGTGLNRVLQHSI